MRPDPELITKAKNILIDDPSSPVKEYTLGEVTIYGHSRYNQIELQEACNFKGQLHKNTLITLRIKH